MHTRAMSKLNKCLAISFVIFVLYLTALRVFIAMVVSLLCVREFIVKGLLKIGNGRTSNEKQVL